MENQNQPVLLDPTEGHSLGLPDSSLDVDTLDRSDLIHIKNHFARVVDSDPELIQIGDCGYYLMVLDRLGCEISNGMREFILKTSDGLDMFQGDSIEFLYHCIERAQPEVAVELWLRGLPLTKPEPKPEPVLGSALCKHGSFPVEKASLVIVDWESDRGPTTQWEMDSSMSLQKPSTNRSVGFLVTNQPSYIVIVQTFGQSQVLGRFTIPVRCVTDIREINIDEPNSKTSV